MNRGLLWLLSLGAGFVLGCGGSERGWRPAPPAGVTYIYDFQGFKEKGTTAFGGVIGVAPHTGIAYGGAFSFREGHEIRGDGWKDPFAESTPIDGVRFNEHLAGQGIPLTPRVAAPTPAASSSAK